jgi:hypothetical protein
MQISSKKVLFALLAALSACWGCAEAPEWESRDLKVVDPDGDCRCVVRKGEAEISVPGTAHDLSAETGHVNAPRALCEMEGDFSVRVKTDCHLSPQTRTGAGRKPYQGASLVVMEDDANYVRLDRAAFLETNNSIYRYANFELRSNFELDGDTPTDTSAWNSFAIGEAYTRFLRLDRVGDRVAAYVSEKWLYLGRKIAKFQAKLKAGVAVINTAKEPLTVRFSEFATARLAKPLQPVAVKPLAKPEQDKLLAARMHGGIAYSFGRCAKLFLLSTRVELPYGVALMTSSRTVAKTELQPVFPVSYRPTLRECLDAIALQTSSQWKYDPTSKFFESEVENGPAEDLAIFEFTEAKRPKPFRIVLPKGWKAIEKGNTVAYVPPYFPVGMEIYELGSYSSDEAGTEAELLKKVVADVSLEWAGRVRDDVGRQDLKAAKVGAHDAFYFETTATPPNVGSFRWRQWVFSVENKCYLALCRATPQFDERIFRDVQAMLKSFEMCKAESGSTVQ